LIFPKTWQFDGVFEIIDEEFKQIRQARHLEIYVVLWKMNNEDSRGLRRLYRG